MSTSETLPQATDAEIAVLGAVMLDNSVLPVVAGVLEPTDFYLPKHRLIYSAMIRLAERSEPVDMATVATELSKSGDLDKAGGASFLIDVGNVVNTSANAPAHAQIIKDCAVLRQLVSHADELRRVCLDHPGMPGELISKAIQQLSTMSAGLTKRANSIGLITQIGDVMSEAIEWLWYPYVPIGKLTILEGDPGVGKTFLALQLAAIVSRGYAFPNHSGQPNTKPLPPSHVLYLSAEDGLADTLRPRLDQANADCSKVSAMTGIRAGCGPSARERAVTLSDIPEIEEAVVRTQAVMVVIDPLQAYLGAGIDMHRANETRPILSGLASLAERQRCAILCVRHLAKARADKAMYQGLGSIDFSGAARSIIRAGHDPQDDTKRLMAHVKCSVAPIGPSIGYEIGPSGFLWTGQSSVSAEQMTAPPIHRVAGQALDNATAWLESVLETGPISSNEVQSRAKREGIGKNTLFGAKTAVGAVAYQSGGIWMWKLPE